MSVALPFARYFQINMLSIYIQEMVRLFPLMPPLRLTYFSQNDAIWRIIGCVSVATRFARKETNGEYKK